MHACRRACVVLRTAGGRARAARKAAPGCGGKSGGAICFGPPPTLHAAKAIEGCLLFEQLSLPAKQAIIRSMTPQAVQAGEVIIRQVGDSCRVIVCQPAAQHDSPSPCQALDFVPSLSMNQHSLSCFLQGDIDASKFYVLERGAADVLLRKEEWGAERRVHAYAPGAAFGELALLYSAPRAATVQATADGKLWVRSSC